MHTRDRGEDGARTVAQEHWSSRPEGGGWFAIWLIRFIGLHCGRTFARLILYPVTAYFYLRRGPERRAARAYFQRMTGNPGTAWQVLRLIHAFAATILDRVFLLAHGTAGFDISVRGVDELERHLARGHGALLIGAHIGSFDVLRVLATRRPDCKLTLVMDKAKTPAINSLLAALAPELDAHVVDIARGGTTVVLALAETARAGGMIALLGDRGRRHEVLRSVPFIGAPAGFPVAPWQIAAALQVPVVLCLGLYGGGNRYDLVFETLADAVTLPRADRGAALDAYIGRYAARLEHYLRQTPYNWFNFYDFWQSQAHAEEPRTAPAALDGVHAA